MMRPIKLFFPYPGQDVPVEMSGNGKACGGDLTILLKPAQGRGIVVLQLKGQPARVWRASSDSDCPETPTITMSDRDALAAMREVRAVDVPHAPTTLKAQWTGHLQCQDDGVPLLTLSRKLAPYETVTLHSTRSGWRWTVDRDPRWFADAKQLKSSKGVPHLTDALSAAMDAAKGLVGAACTVRDTTRRESRDEAYAAQREAKAAAKPKKARKPVKDPTERLKPRKAIDNAANKAAAKAAKAAEREAAKAAKASARAAQAQARKSAKSSSRAAKAEDRRAAKTAARDAAAAEKAAAKAARAEAAREARKAARAAARPAPKAKPVKPPKPPKAATPAEPSAKPKKKKLTQAEKDALLMDVIAKAMRGIE